MGDEFGVLEHQERDRLVLDVYGALDAAGAQRLQELIARVIATHPGAAVLDLANLEMISSSGLQALIVATEAARTAGFALSLRPPGPAVMRVIEVAGVRERLFPDP